MMKMLHADQVSAALVSGQVLDGSAEESGPAGLEATVLREALLDVSDVADPGGLQLKRVTVVGGLDLSYTDIPTPLSFEYVTFTDPIDVTGSSIRALRIAENSELPALLGNHCQILGDLDLSGARVTSHRKSPASGSKEAAIWLCEASIAGRVLFAGTRISVPPDVRAVQADRLAVAGTVRFMRDFYASGELRFIGAQIQGSLDFTAATLTSEEVALDLGEADIGGSLFFVNGPDPNSKGPTVDGRIEMGNVHIRGRWMMTMTSIRHPSTDESRYTHVLHGGLEHVAISAPRVHVGGDFLITKTTVCGAMDLRSAEIDGDLAIVDSRLLNPDHTAVALASARLGSTMDVRGSESPTGPARTEISGSLYAPGMHVYGSVDWKDVDFTNPHRRSQTSVALNHSAIGAPVALQRLQCSGALRAANVEIDGDLILSGCRFGAVQLDNSRVAQVLRIKETHVSSPCEPEGISLRGVHLGSGAELRVDRRVSRVDLTDAHVGNLNYYSEEWPLRYSIKGLDFESIEDKSDASGSGFRAVIDWVDGQEEFDSSPYERLSVVWRAQGHVSEAEEALIRSRRLRRVSVMRRRLAPRYWLDWGFDRCFGYGFRPLRVLAAIVVLIALVGLSVGIPAGKELMRAADPAGNVYSPSTDDADADLQSCSSGSVRCFSPALFAVDNVIPLLDLGQRQTWYPNAAEPLGRWLQGWLGAATILGWIFSSVLVLSMARLARELR